MITDVLFKLLDRLLNGYFSKKKENDLLHNRFDSLKRHVIYTTISNDIPSGLKDLRIFIIEKNLIMQPNIKEFFNKWLTDPIIESGINASNVFSKDEIDSLKAELNKLHLL